MASIVSSSSSNLSGETRRAEAGPLPVKRGEIGFVGTAESNQQAEANRTDEPAFPLPARHPAERDPLPSATHTVPLTPAALGTSTSPQTPNPNSPNPTVKASAPTIWKKVIFAGFHLGTFIIFLVQFLFFVATVTGWGITIVHISKSGLSINSDVLFIHIAFVSFLIIQLILLERRIFRLRAERYSFLHPGEILPTSRHLSRANSHIAFSPWNRPPLPTYAATLAQSGIGTGDVEDNLIAAPPPPAYGNTRGSTMLLSGYLRDSLRAQRPVSEHSQMSRRTDESDRPLSYVSKDEQAEEIRDAERAMRLEQTLAQLETHS